MTTPPGTIHLVWDLPHPPAKVWRALTDPAWVGQWLMPTDMPAEPGKAFTFRTDPSPFWDGIVHSEILELEPGKRLSYRWDGAGLSTVVAWTLAASETGTRLELDHSGFKPENGQAFAGAKPGWQRRVGERLAALLQSRD